MGEMDEIKITYEVLFDILRREKNREELQDLDEDFYEQVLLYLIEKKKITDNHTYEDEIEQNKSTIQIQNIKKILKELYERRERKLINMALASIRTRTNLIDQSSILPAEQALYGKMQSILGSNRDALLNRILTFQEPKTAFFGESIGKSPLIHTKHSVNPGEPSINVTPSGTLANTSAQSTATPSPIPLSSPTSKTSISSTPSPTVNSSSGELKKDEIDDQDDTMMVRFIQSIPKFVGTEMEVYGPFKPDDMANLPALIANVLIKKGRAEAVKA